MKRTSTSISLVIPIYNNETTAINQIKQCEKQLKTITNSYEILLCDDKSTDNTLFLLKENFKTNKKIHIITHTVNKGIAKTIYSLYKQAKKNYIFLFSVDGDWYPSDIPKLVMVAIKNNADMVIGKRNINTYNSYRKFISFSYNFLSSFLFGVNTYDAGSIKIIKKILIKDIEIISKSVFFEAELIIKAYKLGYNIIAYPVRFEKRRKQGSGGKLVLVIQSFFDLIKLRITMLP